MAASCSLSEGGKVTTCTFKLHSLCPLSLLSRNRINLTLFHFTAAPCGQGGKHSLRFLPTYLRYSVCFLSSHLREKQWVHYNLGHKMPHSETANSVCLLWFLLKIAAYCTLKPPLKRAVRTLKLLPRSKNNELKEAKMLHIAELWDHSLFVYSIVQLVYLNSVYDIK